jgi:pimeloyl-ACP methyl ester carboxylesterase
MPIQKPSRPRATKTKPKPASKSSSPSAFERAMVDIREPQTAFATISPSWLLKALGILLLAAMLCAWLTLCLLYWQGNWQLLYQPKPAATSGLARTPASVGLVFEPVKFATTETGTPRLYGWWLPASGFGPRFTVLYLHGASGNLSDTVDTLATLHHENLPIFAFDYRGYGQSQPASIPVRPSEKQLRQDAEWALTYLTLTRAIPAKNIIVFGSTLGANLAAQLAADHSELAGLILDQPLEDPMAPVFNDPRSKLVPAHWIVTDHYDLTRAAATLSVPSLWLLPKAQVIPQSYQADPAKKQAAWLTTPTITDPNFHEALKRWLDNL